MATTSKETDKLREKLIATYALYEKMSATSALDYFSCITIDASPEPAPFRELANPWQWGLVKRFAPVFNHVAGIKKDYTGPLCSWTGLPKGHSKTSMLGSFCNHALAFSRRAWSGYVYAEDRDQAALIVEAMTREARLNPWLGARLEFKHNKVLGACDSHLHVEPADAASAQGPRPDLIIADELVHWSTDEVWKVIVSSLRKRKGCALAVLTNAGTRYTWQDAVRQTAKTSPQWSFYEAPYRLATWMDDDAIAEDRKLLPPSMAARLFDNVWVDGDESSIFVTRAEAQTCADLGIEMGLSERTCSVPGVQYFGAIDFGSVKDYCVCVIGHRQGDILIIDTMSVWTGTRASPVSTMQVENWLDTVRKRFNISCLVIDPFQMQWILEKYARVVPMERWEARAGKGNYEIAQLLRSLIVNRKIAWYPHCGTIHPNKKPHTFVDELSELYVKPYSGGTSYRMQHHSNKHDDRSVAVGMLALAATRMTPRTPLCMSDIFF